MAINYETTVGFRRRKSALNLPLPSWASNRSIMRVEPGADPEKARGRRTLTGWEGGAPNSTQHWDLSNLRVRTLHLIPTGPSEFGQTTKTKSRSAQLQEPTKIYGDNALSGLAQK